MSRKLYAFGSNGAGQLGIDHQEDTDVPTECLLDPALIACGIKAIKAGGNHTLVLTNNGAAYAAGAIEDGRAGVSAQDAYAAGKDECLWWRRVRFTDGKEGSVDRFEMVSATWEASFFLSQEGDAIWACGIGNKGELGLGSEAITQLERPRRLDGFPPRGQIAVDLVSSVNFCCAILDNCEIYAWGNGRKGQIGDPAEIVWQPRRIKGIPFSPSRVTCGREFTVIAQGPSSGALIVLGSDKHGMKSSAPAALKGWKQIEAGWSNVYVLFDTGKVKAWGRNDYGQTMTKSLPQIEQLAAGSEHLIATTALGQWKALGWNAHGNGGEGVINHRSETLQGWNYQSLVGAGCATSFIVGYLL